MTDTLYIIGNGFDLHHGLQTSYANFRDNYAQKNEWLWNAMSTIYGDKLNDKLWWRDFERMLGEIDYEHLIRSYNGKALSAVRVENLLKNMLPPLFGKWVSGLNTNIEKDNSLRINPEAHFFTFNYTLLLEQTYHVKEYNIWHIHNSIKDNNNIIVGHDADGGALLQQHLLYNESHLANHIRPDIQDLIDQGIVKGAKKVKDRIELNKNKFNKYSRVKHFIMMGFSFNDIDEPYIKKIIEVNRNITDTDWKLYWYSDGEDMDMKNKLIKFGVNEENISCKNWQNS